MQKQIEEWEKMEKRGLHLLNLGSSYLLSFAEYDHLRSPYSLWQSRVPCDLLFSISRRPRCIAAVCWFLLRGRVLRPDDACQKRFSWFSDWIPKVQKSVNLVDLVKSFQTR